MNMVLKYIVQENGNIPSWLECEMSKGRVNVNYENEQINSIIVYSVNGTHVAKIGDVILKTESGLAVLPREKAIQYKLITQPVTVSKRSENHGSKRKVTK